ncbi:acyl carrier protein [Chryseobacterium gossypii]|uniref:acyl carrier protein n=1 Tax=Chryseobacterium gossypii TaxID=3231602 RepID=UPI003524D9D2
MKVEQFCELLKQELNEGAAVTPETNFKELESYGSLSAALVMQLVENQFDVKLNPRSFRNVNTVNDLVEAIGKDKFD